MKKLRILLMVIAVGMLTAANVSAQDYKSVAERR